MRFILCFILGLAWTVSAAHGSVSSLVADTRSGFILESHNADEQRPPASLTKLMTLYLTFGALHDGLISMNDKLPVSEHAAAQPKSKIGVIAGDTITVHEAILALIIKSANDVAVVVAEALAGDEERFADLMTKTARTLGLNHTTFKNASGLHAEGQETTARDMAVLSMALIEHYPEYYKLFATPSFTYRGQTYMSHNAVLDQYEGAEGLKTGFVSAVGYNIVSTAKQGENRLVSVVIGEKNPSRRDLRSMRLLDKGFRQVDIQKRAQADGSLHRAFNPLNRKAFIAKPPRDIYRPILQAGLALTRQKLRTLKPVSPPITQIAAVSDTGPEQGDAWGIQVGAFEGQDKARRIAEEAVALLGVINKEILTPRANNRFFRSRIIGFKNQNEAHNACRRLKNASWQCFAVAPRT